MYIQECDVSEEGWDLRGVSNHRLRLKVTMLT